MVDVESEFLGVVAGCRADGLEDARHDAVRHVGRHVIDVDAALRGSVTCSKKIKSNTIGIYFEKSEAQALPPSCKLTALHIFGFG